MTIQIGEKVYPGGWVDQEFYALSLRKGRPAVEEVVDGPSRNLWLYRVEVVEFRRAVTK